MKTKPRKRRVVPQTSTHRGGHSRSSEGPVPGLDRMLFGPAELTWLGEKEDEILRLATRGTRGQSRVAVILPGILGSPIGRPGNEIWMDLSEVPCGGLRQLALPRGKDLRALDMLRSVILRGFYTPTLKALQAAGFEAVFFSYDWRTSIAQLGKDFAGWLHQNYSGREIHLVAHSMGGLVARTAFGHPHPPVKSLTTVGTPLNGAASPLLAMRGIHSFARLIEKFDFRHDEAELAAIFATFPGLLEMMPRFADFDIFDLKNWPSGMRPAPLSGLLAPAGAALADLPDPPNNCTYIAIFGDGVPTITGVSSDPSGFQFTVGRSGDGTVPTAHATPDETLTKAKWYVHSNAQRGIGSGGDVAEHGSLLMRPVVADAIVSLIKGSPPSGLQREPSPAGEEHRLTEAEMHANGAKIRRGVRVPCTAEDFARMHIELMRLTPDLPDPAAPVPVLKLDAVTVRKRSNRHIEIEVACGNIAAIEADALVFGVLEGVDPSTALSAVDRAMNGALGEAMLRRQFQGHGGGVFLLPAGRRLRSDYVILLGLGSPQTLDAATIESAAANLIRTLVPCGIDHFATLLVGSGIGPVQRRIEPFLRGILKTLDEADVERGFRRLTICEHDPATYNAIKVELLNLASSPGFTESYGDIDIDLRERTIPEIATVQSSAARSSRLTKSGTLFLSTELDRSASPKRASWRVRSTWISPHGAAALLNGEMAVSADDLNALLATMPDWNDDAANWTSQALDRFGTDLGRLFLPDHVRMVLAESDAHLVLVHDLPLSRLPWETLRFRGGSSPMVPSLAKGLSRRLVMDGHSAGRWSDQGRVDGPLRMLLVANPTGDLPGAETEADRIERIFDGSVRIVRPNHPNATKRAVLDALEREPFDVLHCASHAEFVPGSPSASGVKCSDDTLSAQDLARSRRVPALVFLNACESARLRRMLRGVRRATNEEHPAASLAEQFLGAGVAQFVGTYWPVGDAGAGEFSSFFYAALKDGDPVEQCILKARNRLKSAGNPDWGNYIHFGPPDFCLAKGPDKP